MKSSPSISLADLVKIENWSSVKEKSWQRILIPPLNLTLNADLIKSIIYAVKMTKHNYAPYYTKIKPQPLSEETQIEKLTQLTQYLPTRQMTIKSAQVDVTFENEFENLTLSLQEAEFVQNEIMYKVKTIYRNLTITRKMSIHRKLFFRSKIV